MVSIHFRNKWVDKTEGRKALYRPLPLNKPKEEGLPQRRSETQ